MHTVKTYGPPGTGKTTRLIKRVTEELERGTPLSRICYLSFSVAAKSVARITSWPRWTSPLARSAQTRSAPPPVIACV